MTIGIQGVGTISPWGNDLKEFYENYRKRKQAFRPKEEFSRFPVDLISAPELAFVENFRPEKYIAKKNLRKYDLYSRLGIASAKQAFENSPKTFSESQRYEMGIVCTNENVSEVTAKYLDDLFETGPSACSPRLFPFTSANSTGCCVAMETGVHGQSLNVGSTLAGSFLALYTGIQMLRANRSSSCLVTGIDRLSKIWMEGYTRARAYKKDLNDPYGFLPGESTTSFILEKLENKKTDNGGVFGNILGINYQTSPLRRYKWPTNHETHIETLTKLIHKNSGKKIQLYFSASNGDKRVDEYEKYVFQEAFRDTGHFPEFIRLKNYLGESTTHLFQQILAACCEPKGVCSLISIIGPGGTHGSILVESLGYLGVLYDKQ